MNSEFISNDGDTHSAALQHGDHGGRMGLLMLLCCMAPIAAIVAVGVFGVPFSGVVTFAILLLCPLMMVFMMADGHRHGGAETGSPQQTQGRDI